MIPLIPGRLHQKRGAGAGLDFRRKEDGKIRTNLLPNVLVYVGPHPEQPHLALFKSEENPNWFYWDIPENFVPLDDVQRPAGAPAESRLGGFRATRPAGSLWGRKEDE